MQLSSYVSAIDANAINLKAIRQAINELASSCAVRPTVISCASNESMLYVAMQSLQVKWIGRSMQMLSNKESMLIHLILYIYTALISVYFRLNYVL